MTLAISFTALIDGQDVVLWYADHLGHRAAEGGDERHGVEDLLLHRLEIGGNVTVH
jgi:hypothetical protein